MDRRSIAQQIIRRVRKDLWAWAEELHPRGEGGKFAPGAGGEKKAEKKKGVSNKTKFGAASQVEGKPALGGKVIEKPEHPAEHTVQTLHAMFEYHTKLQEYAKQTGNLEAAKQEYKNASKYYHAAKKLVATGKKSAPASKTPPQEHASHAPKPEPKAPAPHLEHGATVKVAGKTESGGPMVGTVVGWSKDGTKTAVLQLGKTEAEWHDNAQLSAHATNSSWAKQQEKIGKEVAKDLGPGVSDPGKMNLEHEVKDATKKVEGSKQPKASASKAAAPVSPGELASPDGVVSQPTKWGHTYYSEWKETLTVDENNAVVAYSGTAYTQINSYLRAGGSIEAQGAAAVKAARIQSALMKAPGLPHDTVLKRGMNGDFNVGVGDTYIDNGFMSTSVAAGFSQCKNQLIITAPKGAKGAYLVQSAHAHEHEFLLPAGSKVKVTKIEKKGSKRIIHGELIHHHSDGEIRLDGADDTGDGEVDLSNNDKFVYESDDDVEVIKG